MYCWNNNIIFNLNDQNIDQKHFEIFIGSRSEINLIRKRNLDMLSKTAENNSKFHLKFLLNGWKREIPQFHSKRQKINDIH